MDDGSPPIVVCRLATDSSSVSVDVHEAASGEQTNQFVGA